MGQTSFASAMEFLTAICEVMADAVLVLDEARCVAYANRAAAHRFGASREALVGRPLASTHAGVGPVLDEWVRSGGECLDRPLPWPNCPDLLAFHLRTNVGGFYAIVTIGELEGPVLDRFLEQQRDSYWTARLHEAATSMARATTSGAVLELAAKLGAQALGATSSAVAWTVSPGAESMPAFVETEEEYSAFCGTLADDELGMPGSRLILPLRSEDRVLASLRFGFDHYRRLDKAKRRFAEGLASQAAHVLERVRAEEEERKAKRRLEILAGAAAVFGSSSRGRGEVLTAIARKVAESTNAGCVVRLRPNDGESETVAFHHPKLAARRNLAILVESPEAPSDEATRLTAPLVIEERRVGTLGIVRDGVTPTDDDRRLVEGLAELASVAIENALLHEASEEARRRAEVAAERRARLQEVTSNLSRATSLREIAETTVAQCIRAVGGSSAFLMRLDDAQRTLEIVTSCGLSDRVAATWAKVPLSGEHPAARALHEGRSLTYLDRDALTTAFPAVADDVGAEPAWPAMLVLPLLGSGRKLGTLVFLAAKEGSLPLDDRRLLEAIATQAAQALERALLFASLERELSERRRAEEELASSTRLFESIAEASPDLLYLYDVEARTVMYVNRSVERVLGISARTLQSLSPLDLADRIHPEDWPRVVEENLVLARWRDGEFLEHQFRMRHSSGEYRWLHSRHGVFLRMRNGLPKIILGVAQDVTEARRAERERTELLEREKSARHEAEAANRAKDEFLAMLGHELRNPLAPLVTVLELMRLRGDDALVRERRLMERQVLHLVRLVDDLLDVSRIIRGKTELRRRPIELFAVVAKAIEMASPLVEQRMHRLITSIPQTGLLVMADEHRLAQVVSNLLTNAAKYTEPGGKVMVTAHAEERMVVLRVRDNGIGLAPELLPRVFDLFVQGKRNADRPEGGLGLGLTIVRQLIELHGGTVAAWSEGHGRGSEFTVSLPLAENVPDELVTATGLIEAPRLATRLRRILIVDDNQDAGELLAHGLKAAGHEVRVAFDGPSAFEIARSFEPELALLDIGLPVMDGYEVARVLRETLREKAPSIIAISGYGQESDKRRSREAGFAAHLVKPIALEDLIRMIDRLAETRMAAASS